MYQKIIDFVNEVFRDAPENSIVGFTKKGFISSITKKYDSFLEKGYSEEDAFNLAVSQTPEIYNVAKDMKKFMGKKEENSEAKKSDAKDGDEIFTYRSGNAQTEERSRTEKDDKPEDYYESADVKRKIGYFTSVFWPLLLTAYFLYSFLVPGAWSYSWVIFIIGVAVTCLVKFFTYKSNHAKKHAISGVLWLLAVTAYLIVSFLTSLWYITWIIFPVTAAIQCIINLCTAKTRAGKTAAVSFAVWLFVLTAYFLVSFLTGAWYLTWVIFIAGAALQTIAKIITDKLYDDKDGN